MSSKKKNIKMCQMNFDVRCLKYFQLNLWNEGPGIPLHFIQYIKRKTVQIFFAKEEAWCKKINVFLTESNWHQWNQIQQKFMENK